MSSRGDLPAGLQKIIPGLPVDGQVKLIELHGKYNFNDDQLDCFLVNHKSLEGDNLKLFQMFLEEELIKASAKPSRAGDVRSKRKSSQVVRPGLRGPGVPLPASVGAALGVVGASQAESQSTTPKPKRHRDQAKDALDDLGGEPGPAASRTPDPPSKPIQVSLKSSMNSGNITKPSMKTQQSDVKVELLDDNKLWAGPQHGMYAWADESLEDWAAARDERLASMEASFTAALSKRDEAEEEVAVGTIGVSAQSEVVLCGRLLCESLEGRLNERSLLLEGSRTSSALGARVQLNVAECKQIAAFPGQIVAVLGRSGMTGSSFHAREFLAGLPPPPAIAPRGDGPLHMMVLAGPFCLRDGLDYSPFEEALQHVARERPQVLVILGPFLDAANQKVASGETTLPGDQSEVVPYEEVYSKHILPMLTSRLQPLRGSNSPTEVLIVPSLEEVLCFHPLPQPPLNKELGPQLNSGAWERLEKLGVRFLPNPAHIRINDLRVSLTSADALSPVLREIVLRPEGRKIDEALRLLLRQRTLFPVVPRDPAQICEARAAALDFAGGEPPDLCIFPSMSGTATGTIVDGTLVINPGSLCRPAALGTFADLMLTPQKGGAPLQDCARVDIQKLDFQKTS